MTFPLVRLDQCSRIVSGATPSTSNAEFWSGDIFWVTPADLSKLDGPTISHTPRTITLAGLASCAAELLPPNSVLFSSRAPIGHVAINTVPMATNQGFKSFIPVPDKLNPNYLYHWLKANRTYLERLGNGATFKEVSKAVVSRIQLPLPPLDKQRRIAAILDQAHDLRHKRREALTCIGTLSETIFIEMFGDIESNKFRWPTAALSEVVRKDTIITYGIVQAGEEFEGGVPYIRTGDIVNGEIRSDQLRRTDPTIAAKFSRSRVETNEIVMSIRATVGTTAFVPSELDGANLTQGTARISPGKRTDRHYLLAYLRSNDAQNWLQRQVKGATFREITLSRLREMPILVPPLNLQHSFAARVAEIEKLKAHHHAHLAKLNTLFASLQHRAFRSEL